ncbi:helicase domain-containing protein [Alcanivorax sp. 521-1]|uniref:Helicase domain-containing protein n=2 Tax=Alloalcanivorax profundimaris TaxID=2735259 RepID=A0ABS0AN21_9GAMM|nr:helicase domain-containing protein [Alloalcanivorax profundimaris]
MNHADALPIDPLKEPFLDALDQGPVVVSAATGSGKSTRLPVWALARGPVLVVEPRRVACTALAGFLAGQRGQAAGDDVGYAVRFDTACTDQTPLVFVTPGIALRWYREGRLKRFTTVMLDEFHERRWDTDLLLALLKQDGGHRLVVTSATLDGPRLARYLDAEALHSEGRGYPVNVRHHADNDRQMPDARDLPPRVREAVRAGLADDDDGDVLVFLPGRREIQQAATALASLDAEVLPLHAGVTGEAQRRALTPGPRRRVILATNVAETSLTIPGVTLVVDAGLERRTHQRNGRTVLSLTPISQASADQRRGRAGRTAPGRVIRLWGENAPLEARTPPEIQREELGELVLAAACAGRRAGVLDFPDPLPAHTLDRAERQLNALGALDADGRATERGHALFALPVDTFFAHLIVAMADATAQGFMVDLAAALSARRRPLTLPRDEDGRRALADWEPRPCDATTLVRAVRQVPPDALKPNRAARDEARQLATQMRALLKLPGLPASLDEEVPAILAAALAANPRAAFLRREKERRRDAMGNGGEEVRVGEDSRFPEEAQAALVLDSHSLPGKGTRQTLTLATCLAPVPVQALVEQGLAEPETGGVEWHDGEPVVTRHWYYAGRRVHTDTARPEGAAARQVLARLILDGDCLAPAGERLMDDLDAWRLYLALGHDQGDAPEAAPWLARRLGELGVENLDDRALLEPRDLRFPGIPDWERQRFDEKYPRFVALSDLKMRVHYQIARRRVELEYRSGSRKAAPRRWELPAWSGWRVRYRKASRVVDVI